MFVENNLGFEYQDHNIIVFFGKKNTKIEDLEKYFPQLKFRTIRQTHSRIVLPSVQNSQDTEADAHFTKEKNVALVVKTADCLPIMIYSSDLEQIAAVHAGWRGVENQITREALKNFKSQDVSIYIGPHILKNSFEVQSDVKDQLLKAYYGKENIVESRGDRYLIDLQKIVRSQTEGVNFEFLALDTFKNPLFNSFRSDQTTQRNLSFIAQKTAPV